MQKNLKTLLILHVFLLIFSISNVCSKNASEYSMLSTGFLCWYALSLVLLGVYAIAWQQILKRLPLSSAYSNKAITIVWGIAWGGLIFHEEINPGMILGALIIIAGIVLYAFADNRTPANPETKLHNS